jgi:hypothetical protein
MTYQYAPLSVQDGDAGGLFAIRLLYLLPDVKGNSIIQCRLVETLIPDSRRAKSTLPQTATHAGYHALSYTWGEPLFTKALHIVEGGKPVGDINVTENLYSALQNLRLPDKELVLWVDAVCINQADIHERNSQVSNIPQTYSEALGVLVWLGADSSYSDGQLCLDFFNRLALHIETNPNPEKFFDQGSWRWRLKIYKMTTTFLDSAKNQVVSSFLSRPWFRRRWIIQEVVLARDLKVYCGTSSITWSSFELALSELFDNHRDGFHEENRTTLRTMSRIRDVESGAKSQAPLDTLVEFSRFLCSNPRDRLYALYGVIQHWLPRSSDDDFNTGGIDYAASVGEVYTTFAILMMHLNHSRPSDVVYNSFTHVLQLAAAFKYGIKESQEPGEASENMPTWVPDWTGTLCYKALDHSPLDRDASSGIPVKQIKILPFNNGNRILLATGIVYDIITTSVSIDIEPLFGSSGDAKKVVNNFLSEVDSRCQETGFFRDDDNTYAPTNQHFIIALATSIVANWEHTPENSYFAQNPRFPSDFLEQLGQYHHRLPEILHKWPAYVEIITETMRGRRLFLTQSGYIGIGDLDIQTDDVVCILSGTRIPFIFRPTNGRTAKLERGLVNIDGCHNVGSDDEFHERVKDIEEDLSKHCTFKLLGDAYVHGLMNGELAEKLGASGIEDAYKILPVI